MPPKMKLFYCYVDNAGQFHTPINHQGDMVNRDLVVVSSLWIPKDLRLELFYRLLKCRAGYLRKIHFKTFRKTNGSPEKTGRRWLEEFFENWLDKVFWKSTAIVRIWPTYDSTRYGEVFSVSACKREHNYWILSNLDGARKYFFQSSPVSLSLIHDRRPEMTDYFEHGKKYTFQDYIAKRLLEANVKDSKSLELPKRRKYGVDPDEEIFQLCDLLSGTARLWFRRGLALPTSHNKAKRFCARILQECIRSWMTDPSIRKHVSISVFPTEQNEFYDVLLQGLPIQTPTRPVAAGVVNS